MRNDTQMTGMIKRYKENWHGMTGWLWNESSSRIKGFALVKKWVFISPHSVIPSSFLLLRMEQKWLEWVLNELSPLQISIPCHSTQKKMMQEWPNEEEWESFFEGRKNWIFWRLPFCYHSTIQTSFDVDNSPVLKTILGWAGMKGKWGQNDLIQCFLL